MSDGSENEERTVTLTVREISLVKFLLREVCSDVMEGMEMSCMQMDAESILDKMETPEDRLSKKNTKEVQDELDD